MIRTWRRIFVAALFICSAGAAEAAADVARPCEREMARAAQQHGIPLGILYAVGLTETGRRGALHPFALGAEGQEAGEEVRVGRADLERREDDEAERHQRQARRTGDPDAEPRCDRGSDHQHWGCNDTYRQHR